MKSDWGCYKIEGNQIFAQDLSHSDFSYQMQSSKFEITSDTTLLCYYITSSPTPKQEFIWQKDTVEYTFHPLENRVDSTNCIKAHKWFWVDKEAYKEYKPERKPQK